jgi:hypothetical protein
VAFAIIVMGLILACILSGILCRMTFRHRLKGLYVFRIEVECHLHLDPYLEAGVKCKVTLALAYSGT